MKQWISKNRKPIIIISAILLLLILLFLLLMVLPRRDAIVQNTGGSFFRARNVQIIGPVAVMRADSEMFKNRTKALGHSPSTLSFSFFSMDTIRTIEFIETAEETPSGEIPVHFLGSYTIIASAHKGYLNLWMKNGRVYGNVRFPHWARGATEYLKGVSIKGENIRFVRSVTTAKEQRRVGAGSYFTQVYYGKYYGRGKKIKGYYTKNGHRGLWEATKIR